MLPRVGHKLYKYLRLISGPIGVKAGLESVVDDLVIHLLDALGFNDGPLAVLSKNRLRLHMNQDKVACAIADVTVYDVDSNFRLAVTEVSAAARVADGLAAVPCIEKLTCHTRFGGCQWTLRACSISASPPVLSMLRCNRISAAWKRSSSQRRWPQLSTIAQLSVYAPACDSTMHARLYFLR